MPGGGTVAIPAIPIPPRPVTPSGRGKLRKKRADGYDSDGGYISEGGKKKEKKTFETKEVSGGVDVGDKKERAKEAKARAKDEKLQEKREKEEERKRKKSLISTSKAPKKAMDEFRPTSGYETDGGSSFGKGSKSMSKSSSKKVKAKSSDVGYETDSGYLSSTPNLKAKSKSRFFKLRTKQSKPDLHEEIAPNLPTVEKEIVPLPIASRFATTLGSASTSLATNTGTSVSVDTRYSPLPSINTSPSTTFVAAQSPTLLNDPGVNRDSYGSAESGTSSSSAPKRRGVHFASNSNGHGNESGSFSTITSPSHIPLPLSTLTSPASSSSFSAISLPLTHTHSTISFHSQNNPDNHRHSPGSLATSPYSPNYPPSALSNSVSRNPSRAPSPSPGIPTSPAIHVTSTSIPPLQVRPRFPPTDGFGPRPTPSPTPSALSPGYMSPRTLGTDSPNIVHRPTLSQLSIIPSSEYIVPSPRGTPLPSPNVLAYYDIPPPSPPPMGPLPSVPEPTNGAGFSHSMRARNHGAGSISRGRTPEQGLFTQPIPNIQRGRESPFPARPILPGTNSGSTGVGTGLEARVRVPRYRDLYALDSPPGGWSSEDRNHKKQANETGNPGINVVEPTEDGWDYDEEEEEDMRDVLDRFEEARMGAETGRALGRSRSFEALRSRLPEHGGSEYYDDEDEAYSGERTSTEESGGQRTSRWSGSIYSRASFLDPEKSEETRERFIQRVEAMYGEDGRENTGGGRVVPPVPKIPDSLLGAGAQVPGRIWNRF